DVSGKTYVIGYTASANFPTLNALQPANAGANDAFVSTIKPDGSGFVYSTYLGGTADDFGQGIAVDNEGSAYITGATFSTNFPVLNALQATNNGGIDAFVAKVNPAG